MSNTIFSRTAAWRVRTHRGILVLVSALACRGDTRGDGATATTRTAAEADTAQVVTMSAAALQHGGVRWQPAETRESAGIIEAPGQLVPDEDRTARIGAPLPARVVAVHVQSGSRVGVGQALVTLLSAEAGTARADLQKATAELAAREAAAAYARSARERAERLLAAKAAARQEVERAQADDALGQSALSAARSEVARARSAVQALGGGAGSSGTVVVRSPLAGIVLSREATPGAVVVAGAPLVSVTDATSLWLDMSLPPAAASSLAPGSRVRFSVAAFPADTFQARVVSIAGALDPQTRALPVRAAVVSTRNRLRSAMFATVRLDAGARTVGIAVPSRAVMLLDGRQVVFVARPLDRTAGGVRLERRDIIGDGEEGGITRVRSGVKPGELVVTDGAFAVKATFSRGKMPAGG